MTSFKVPFSRPSISEEEIQEVVHTLRSGWITTGPKSRLFESNFASYLSSSETLYCLAVNSATSGLHLSLEALGIGPGDEVITTTYTFTATAEVIRYLGAKPIFVDIDPDTFNINPSLVIPAITSRTKAILPVHFAGLSANMDEIFDIARSNNLFVVEDAAHALPTTYKGSLIGTLASDFTVFSFYANKTMTTGEGGMVVTSNKGLAERVRTMRLHGINKDAFNRFQSTVPAWAYDVIAPGFKYNITDIAASIGIHQLKRVDLLRQERQSIFLSYNEAFSSLPLILPPFPDNEDLHSCHLYVVRLNGEFYNRDSFISYLFDKGIGCSVHYTPLHLLSYWRDTYKLSQLSFPCAQQVFDTCVSLPIYPGMSSDQIQHVISSVKSFF